MLLAPLLRQDYRGESSPINGAQSRPPQRPGCTIPGNDAEDQGEERGCRLPGSNNAEGPVLEKSPGSFDLDELVAGYRVGNVILNFARLGPPPGTPWCRIDPAILRRNGYP